MESSKSLADNPDHQSLCSYLQSSVPYVVHMEQSCLVSVPYAVQDPSVKWWLWCYTDLYLLAYHCMYLLSLYYHFMGKGEVRKVLGGLTPKWVQWGLPIISFKHVEYQKVLFQRPRDAETTLSDTRCAVFASIYGSGEMVNIIKQ